MNQPLSVQYSHYLKLINRKKIVWIPPILLCPFLFLLLSFVLPKIFEAKAIILIQEQKMVNPLLKNLVVENTLSDRIAALKEEILAWPRLLLLVERLGLQKKYELDQGTFKSTIKKFIKKIKQKGMMSSNSQMEDAIELEQIIKELQEKIHIKMKGKSVVTIAYKGEDPQQTQQLVNTLSDIIIKKNLTSQKEDTSSAIDFIKEQLKIYKEKLDDSEKALREFKEVYGENLIATKGIKTVTKKTISGEEEEKFEGLTLTQINEEISKLEAQLVYISVDYTEKHQDVIDIKNLINVLKDKRNQLIEKAAEKIGAEPENYLEIADSIPKQQETLSRLERDNDINSKIYGMLLERYETAKITERLDTSSNRTKFRIVEPARLPLKPISPNKLKLFILGIGFGIALGFGLVFMLDMLDSSIKNEDQLEEEFEIPVLGKITKY